MVRTVSERSFAIRTTLVRRRGRDCRLWYLLAGVSGFQVTDRQRRYGLWGLQVTCRIRSMARVATTAIDGSVVVPARCRHRDYVYSAAWARSASAYSVR